MKVGSKIKCVDNFEVERYFTLSKTYTIIFINNNCFNLKDFGTSIDIRHLRRFKLVNNLPLNYKGNKGDV